MSSSNWVTFEEKYFRRIEKFNGDPAECKGWMFDLKVAVGQVDWDLVNEISKTIRRNDNNRFSERWDPAGDSE
eukprot:6433833-Karenia_brevis.AAC.1